MLILGHYYTYDKAGFDEGIFPTPRFASEYGFQSLPSVSSWLTVANLSDLNINTDFMKHRQHHPIGNAPLKNFIELQMELPSEDNEYYDEAFIYYTQVSVRSPFLDGSIDINYSLMKLQYTN